MDKYYCNKCGCKLIPGENWLPGNQKQHHCICRDCIRQHDKQYREKHKEEIRQYSKQYREKHKRKIRQYRKEHKKEEKQYNKEYKEKHKEELKYHSIERIYGLSPEEYDAMLKAQHNRCAICRKPFVDAQHTHIDHDHATGKVRGILCSNCNHMLGMAHDNPKILQEGIDYLKRSWSMK